MTFRKPLEKIGIITKRHLLEDPGNLGILQNLLTYLKKRNKEIFLDSHAGEFFKNENTQTQEQILKTVDLVITLGGDGTMLKTASRVSRRKVHILAVNLGNLGFLTESTPDRLLQDLDLVFQGKYHVDRRCLLRATLYRNGKKIHTYLALNDSVINQGSFARLITLDLEINGRKMAKFKADGVIVSTPTGSTAHSLSAGGPIVHPGIEGLIITPICPSSLSMRSIVIPASRQLTINLETRRRAEVISTIGLTIDGQDTCMLVYGDQI